MKDVAVVPAELADLADRTVGEVMVRGPKVHPADLTVAAAREVLTDDHVHMVLLASDDDALVGTLVRDDLEGAVDASPATEVGVLAGRVVGPDALVGDVLPALHAALARRLAVVDDAGRLVGLLCLKRSRRGFCDDVGVAARAAERDVR